MNTSSGPAAHKISPSHLGRDAYVYIRQSTQTQVMMNTESLARQYELAGRAGHLGWHTAQIVTIDADLGQSGARSDERLGFKELVADVGLGKVGIVLGIEVSRLVRDGQLPAIHVNNGQRRSLRIQVKPEAAGLFDTPK